MPSGQLTILLSKYYCLTGMVSIPGIGFIQRTFFSARHQFTEKKYQAPYQQVFFDPVRTEIPHKQLDYLAKASGKAKADIQFFLLELKDAIISALTTDRKLEWRGIGIFHLDDEGTITFHPRLLAIDYCLDVPYQHVIRKNIELSITVGEEEKSNAEMETYFEDQQNYSRWRTWKMVSLFLIAASIAIILYRISLGGFSVLGPTMQKITPRTPAATHLLP